MIFFPMHERKICILIDKQGVLSNTIKFTVNHIANANDDLIVLNARKTTQDYPVIPPYGFGIEQAQLLKLEKYFQQQSYKLLKSAVDYLNNKGLRAKGISVGGEIKEAIQLKINELKPDLVIMGKRDLNAFKRIFLGSVSEYMIKYMDVAMIIVPDDLE